MQEFKLKRYESIDGVIAELYGIPEGELSSDGIEGKGISESGEEVDFNYEQQKEGISKQGYWGWVDDSKVIHYWIGKDTPIKELIHFFAHEIGHQTGEQNSDDYLEEMRAEQFGRVATLAYDLAVQSLKPNAQP
jgi:hypothetical protein